MHRTSTHSKARVHAEYESITRPSEPRAGALSEIMRDASLSPDETWLMIEALFVHDASELPPLAAGDAVTPAIARAR